jgi:hypothetical protein
MLKLRIKRISCTVALYEISGFRRVVHETWDIMQRKVVTPYQCFGTIRAIFKGKVVFLDWDRQVVPKHQYGIANVRCVMFQNSADLSVTVDI